MARGRTNGLSGMSIPQLVEGLQKAEQEAARYRAELERQRQLLETAINRGSALRAPKRSPRSARASKRAGERATEKRVLAYVTKHPGRRSEVIGVALMANVKGALARLREKGLVTMKGQRRGATYYHAKANG